MTRMKITAGIDDGIVQAGADTIKMQVSWAQLQVLNMLKDRGGRSMYRFGVTDEDTKGGQTVEDKLRLQKGKEAADVGIQGMEKLALITLHPLIGIRNTSEMKLTDAGIAILDAWLESRKQQGAPK